MYKTINSPNLSKRHNSNSAASEEILNAPGMISALLILANLTALLSKEKVQNLALEQTTSKSTRLQMGFSAPVETRDGAHGSGGHRPPPRSQTSFMIAPLPPTCHRILL